jgi:hypothetical protein
MQAKSLLAALLVAAASARAATPDTIGLYAHSVALTVSGKNAVVRAQLPLSVYLNSRSETLDDVRIFDAQGKALPFSLLQAQGQTQTNYRKMPLKIFPVLKDEARDGGRGTDVDIRASPDGSLVSVSTRSAKAGPGSAALEALVLDATRPGEARPAQFDAMRFSLPPGTGSYHAQIQIEGSDDLKQWRHVANSSLSWLVDGTTTLANDRIEFASTAFRYARVSWMSGTPLRFAGIEADSPATTRVAAPLMMLQLEPQAGRAENDLVYLAGPAIPVQRMGMKFDEKDVVLPVLIGRYVDTHGRHGNEGDSWAFRPLAQSTFFDMTQSGQVRRSDDIALDGVHAAEWVIRPQVPVRGKPRLQLGWTPASIVFLAGGPGPFRLAAGRDKAPRAQLDLSQVAPGFSAAEIDALEFAQAGEASGPQGAVKAPVQEHQNIFTNRRAMLWAVLLLGLAVLAYMVWRLVRQMQTQPEIDRES